MNVFLGPTGTGKTTLMRIMAGLEKPSSGAIYWNDDDVTGRRVQDRDIAFVYQQFINYPSMSVYENIASPLRLKKAREAEVDFAVHEAARMMKLDDYLDRSPLELSGGQQQRCALARALVKGAGLVLLDEPLANLDYKLREELRSEIPNIFEASGAIFVYATTDPEEALLLGGNTASLSEGRISQYGLTPDVYHKPANMITAETFSSPPMNFVQLSKRGGQTRIGGALTAAGGFENLQDGEYQAGFRPNHLSLTPEQNSVAFDAHLNSSEITGSETFLHMRHETDHWVALLHGIHDLPMDQEHKVYVSADHIYIFEAGGALIKPAAYAKGMV
ncbi:UNVERIFIED_CONTAM: hypothetical protein GTU68_017756 [Idotea baltica]|nr:hypothetical protein [Idotea baltica]